MRKILLSVLFLGLSTSAAFAANPHSQNGAAIISGDSSTNILLSPTVVCNPNANWKNHGEYVSCVAHEHIGGNSVPNAAQSNIGKKNNVSSSITSTIGVLPSSSGSPTNILSPTISPIGSPSATPTGSLTNDLISVPVHVVTGFSHHFLSFLQKLFK